MPVLIFGSILIQILCAVHCVRGGRNQMWLMVIIFLSLPGCLAYFIFEILPGLVGRREVQSVKAAAVRKLDPERAVRAAHEALEVADTAANRIALADALAEQERWAEAIAPYDAGIAMAPGPERGVRVRLARACLEAGQAERARTLLETLPPTHSSSEADRASLLLAQALEALGESERALALYSDVGERLPGAEAQCRQAALLIARGRREAALPVLIEVEKRLKRIDPHERARQRAMFDWAARTLAELQTGV